MKKCENPAFEYISDKSLIELINTPYEICNKYKIPFIVLDDVLVRSEGRKKILSYMGSDYSRVELVAKRFYEEQGFYVSWNEGAVFHMIRAAVNAAIMNRLGSAVTVSRDTRHPFFTENDWIVLENIFEHDKAAAYHSMRGVMLGFKLLYPKVQVNNPDLDAGYPQTPEEVLVKSGLKFSDSLENISGLAIKALADIKENPPLEEYAKSMRVLIDERAKSQPKWQSNSYNDWSLDFALKVIETIGIDFMGHELLETGYTFTSLENFDLTLLDVVEKKLKFVEVKNKDGFTAYQLVDLDAWLSKRDEMNFSFEMCFVWPKDVKVL